MPTRLAIAAIAVATTLLLMGSPLGSTTKVTPHTLQTLGGVWVGGQPEGILEYFRLELSQKGSGLLTVQYLPTKPAVAYVVAGTTLDRYDVSFNLHPAEPDAEPIYLKGQAIGGTLRLRVGGTQLDWDRQLFLQRYEDLMARIDAVTVRADKYAAQHQ